MAIRKPIVRVNGRATELSSADRVEGAGVVYVATTAVQRSITQEYVNVGSPDQDGKVLFNLTVDGTAGGTALFSQILNVQVTAVYAAATPKVGASAYVQSVSANLKVVDARAISDGKALANLGSLYIRVIGYP